MVRKMVVTSFSRAERARRAVARLLADLRADGTFTEEHVAVGLTRVVRGFGHGASYFLHRVHAPL